MIRAGTSKTDPYRKGITIYIAHTIPVHAMLHYLKVRIEYIKHQQNNINNTNNININNNQILLSTDILFLHTLTFSLSPSYHCLTRQTMIYMIRTILSHLGYDSKLYSGHSFRKGGATSLSEKGISDSMIQTIGRWTSDCYKIYITIPIEKILLSNRSM